MNLSAHSLKDIHGKPLGLLHSSFFACMLATPPDPGTTPSPADTKLSLHFGEDGSVIAKPITEQSPGDLGLSRLKDVIAHARMLAELPANGDTNLCLAFYPGAREIEVVAQFTTFVVGNTPDQFGHQVCGAPQRFPLSQAPTRH